MDHIYFMQEAIKEAKKALEYNDVPVGAIVVKDGEIIGRGYNSREADNDPTAHAEIIALKNAGIANGHWNLTKATIYVTLEPCPMCAGAIVQSRIKELVYGADDKKAGAAGSQLNLLQFPGFNHNVKIRGPVLEEECTELLQSFFKSIRNK